MLRQNRDMYREKKTNFFTNPRPKQKQKQNIHPQIQQAPEIGPFLYGNKNKVITTLIHTKSKQTPRSFEQNTVNKERSNLLLMAM